MAEEWFLCSGTQETEGMGESVKEIHTLSNTTLFPTESQILKEYLTLNFADDQPTGKNSTLMSQYPNSEKLTF